MVKSNDSLFSLISGNQQQNGFITIPITDRETVVSICFADPATRKSRSIIMVRELQKWFKIRLFLKEGDRVRIKKPLISNMDGVSGITMDAEYYFDGQKLNQINRSTDDTLNWVTVSPYVVTHCVTLFTETQRALFLDVYPEFQPLNVGVPKVEFIKEENIISTDVYFPVGVNLKNGKLESTVIKNHEGIGHYDCLALINYAGTGACIKFVSSCDNKLAEVKVIVTELLYSSGLIYVEKNNALRVYNSRGKSFGYLTT